MGERSSRLTRGIRPRSVVSTVVMCLTLLRLIFVTGHAPNVGSLMTAISMLQRTFWLWDSQLLPVERWSDLDGRKLAQAHLREAGKPTREGGSPLGLPIGRMSMMDRNCQRK